MVKRRTTSSRRKKYTPRQSRYASANVRNLKPRRKARFRRNTIQRMSSCARDYLKVQYAPFDGRPSASPCIPDQKAFPSHKFYLRKRFTMNSVGLAATGEHAVVLFNPFTIDKDGANHCVSHTNGVTDAVNATFRVSTQTGWAEKLWDSPYATAFGAANYHRVVAAGVRMSYAGAWDSCQGVVAVYAHPQNSGMTDDTITFDDLLTYDETAFAPLENGKVYEAVYHPRTNADFDYAFSSVSKMGCLAIAVQGCADASEFACDVIAWYEGIGDDFNGMTQSHSDVVMLGKINSLPKNQTAGVSGIVRQVGSWLGAM